MKNLKHGKRNALLISLLIFGGCTATTGHLPQVSGHRGANAIAPENTLASADSCIRYGVDYMECDVCISQDSVFYILHDSTLDRTTNGSGAIAQWKSADIDTLDAGAWFAPEFAGTRVTRFEELLRHVKGRLKITVDYRSGDLGKLLELVRSTGMEGSVNYNFGDESLARQFRRMAPEAKTLQAYVASEADVERVVREIRPDIAVVWIDSLDRSFLNKCRENGMQVLALALGMGNMSGQNRKAVELGVDILATDRPERFLTDYPRR